MSDSADSSSHPGQPPNTASRTPTRPFVAPPARPDAAPRVGTPPGRPVLRPFSPPGVRPTIDASTREPSSLAPEQTSAAPRALSARLAELDPDAPASLRSLGPPDATLADEGFRLEGSASEPETVQLQAMAGHAWLGSPSPDDLGALEQLKEIEPWALSSPDTGLGEVADALDVVEAVAAALDRVARRVRAGEVVVESSRSPATDEEALALALLALLTPPR